MGPDKNVLGVVLGQDERFAFTALSSFLISASSYGHSMLSNVAWCL